MRILCIAPHVPWPLHGGPQLRIYHTIRVLNERGHDITLLAGHPEGESLPDRAPLDRITREIDIFATESSGRLRGLLRSLASLEPYPAQTFSTTAYREKLGDHVGDDWDLILVNHLILVEALRDLGPSGTPIVLDQHESELEIWQGYARDGNVQERLFALQNLPKVRRARRRAWPLLDAVICVAEEEIIELQNEAPERISLLLAPNGVDTAHFDPSDAPPLPERDPNVVFCAGMGVERNAQAAHWFAERVFPHIRERVPEARFWIVGADPPEQILNLEEREGIEVTGTVPEVKPYYERARVAVIPNRFGGFSKLKLSEALAMGLPVVATKSGAKGAPAGGDLIQTAEDAGVFAETTARLLTDDEEAEKIGAQARHVAERELGWDTVLDDLESNLEEVATTQGRLQTKTIQENPT